MKKRGYYLYVLRDGAEVVYYGITHARERSVLEKEHTNKNWTNYSILKGPLHRDHAKNEAQSILQFFQRSNDGKLPRYNI